MSSWTLKPGETVKVCISLQQPGAGQLVVEKFTTDFVVLHRAKRRLAHRHLPPGIYLDSPF